MTSGGVCLRGALQTALHCGDTAPLTDTNMTRRGCLCYFPNHFVFMSSPGWGDERSPEGPMQQPLPPLSGANRRRSPSAITPQGRAGVRGFGFGLGWARSPLRAGTAQGTSLLRDRDRGCPATACRRLPLRASDFTPASPPGNATEDPATSVAEFRQPRGRLSGDRSPSRCCFSPYPKRMRKMAPYWKGHDKPKPPYLVWSRAFRPNSAILRSGSSHFRPGPSHVCCWYHVVQP